MKNFIFRKLFFFIFISVSVVCTAQEVFDVEVLPKFRTQHYSIKPYKKIIVFSAPRTGSSLVYNIFRFLFEEDSKIFSHHNDFDQSRSVLKTHRFYEVDLIEEEDVLYVFTIRNPREASISNDRICPHHITDHRAFAEDLINRHKSSLLFSENLQELGEGVVRLKYEDFLDNIEDIFTFIEGYFSISIHPEDKELMKKGYSKQNIDACTSHLPNFTEYLPVSGFHGLHVNMGHYTPCEEFLYWLDIHLETIKPLFRNYGYFLDLDSIECK